MAKKTNTKEKPLLSGYKDTLKSEEVQRYSDKLGLIGGNDPYELVGWLDCEENFPSVSYPDIVNYLLFTPSPYTSEDLKAYKNTDCYKQALCGWVSDVATITVQENIIVSAKVRILNKFWQVAVNLLKVHLGGPPSKDTMLKVIQCMYTGSWANAYLCNTSHPPPPTVTYSPTHVDSRSSAITIFISKQFVKCMYVCLI